MDVNDICSMSYKILIKEIEDGSKKWKDTYYAWIRSFNILKMTKNLVQSLSNYPDIFHGTRTNNLNIYVEPSKDQNYQSNPEEKEQTRKCNTPRLQTILQSSSCQNGIVIA